MALTDAFVTADTSRLVKVKDRYFKPFISQQQIEQRLEQLSEQLNREYRDKNPIFVSILNGSFIFAADLVRKITVPCEVSFIKFTSYRKMQSSGNVDRLIGLKEDIRGRHVVIVEDIVDTGLTMSEILREFSQHEPASLEIATLLLKPEALKQPLQIKYLGFSIENRFVVGYGLDYDGYGRNLKEIYVVNE